MLEQVESVTSDGMTSDDQLQNQKKIERYDIIIHVSFHSSCCMIFAFQQKRFLGLSFESIVKDAVNRRSSKYYCGINIVHTNCFLCFLFP